MDLELPGRRRSVEDTSPAYWPERTRRLIDEVRRLCRDWLSEPLRLCLGDFDRALHERAASARGHLDHQRYQATRQRLVLQRQAFEDRFTDCIDRALLQLGAQAAPAKAPARLTLSLLDPLEHEMAAAMDQLIARSEARSGTLLVELSYRLAVLIGAPPLENEAMPLGPQAMARAFRDSSATLGLPAEHHLLLLQAMEGKLLQGLAPLHELVNGHLAAAGILPRLRPFPLPRAPRQPRQRPVPSAPASTPRAAAPAPHGLRELLAQQRGARPMPDHARFATPDEMQAALAALQRLHDGADLLRPVQRLRAALIDQLNIGQPIEAMPIVPGPDADDAMELTVRLFNTLHGQLPTTLRVRALLDRLQFSTLRAAVADGGFFDRREDPARRLFERIVGTARWLDDGDGSLLGQLEQALDHLDRPSPDPALCAELDAGLERQTTQLQRKAQAAERRHVEAMQGRERLEQARQRAGELLAGLLAKAPPRNALRALFEHAWSDVLALTLLRHGEQSDTFARRLMITDQLLGRLPPGNLDTLQGEVEAGLQQIGMHGEEAREVAQRLIGAGAVMQEADTPGLAMRLKPSRHAGAPEGAAPQPVPPLLTAEALRLHQRLSQHPGGWFEFADPDGGRVQRKLAWYSARATRGLFVTPQGQRAGEMGLAELAKAIAGGQVREIPAANGSELDRAWRTLADSLRQGGPMPGARS